MTRRRIVLVSLLVVVGIAALIILRARSQQATLTGLVTQAGKPVPGCLVHTDLKPRGGDGTVWGSGRSVDATSDDRGRYEMRVRTDGEIWIGGVVPGRGIMSYGILTDLQPGETREVNVQLPVARPPVGDR